jgi:hypothetical protein
LAFDASFDESTPESTFEAKIQKWAAVTPDMRLDVWKNLLELNKQSLEDFMFHLKRAVLRQINAVRIIPLHGSAKDCITIVDAIAFIENYDETAPAGPLVKYEVIIRYDNGDNIEARFQDRATTIEFLSAYKEGNWKAEVGDLVDDDKN